MNQTLGGKIRELRLARNMTQSELGRNLVTASMISQIEADKANPSNKLLARLAERLGVPLHFFREDIQTKEEKSNRLKYARILMEAKNYQAAAELLQELVQTTPSGPPLFAVQSDLATCLVKIGSIDEAIKLNEKLIHDACGQNDFVSAVKLYCSLGLIEFERNNWMLADFYWSKAVTLCTKHIPRETALLLEALLLHGKVQNQLYNFADAYNTLLKAEKLLQGTNHVQKRADFYALMCQTQRGLHNYPKAVEFAQKAITAYDALGLSDRTAEMKIQLTEILDENGNPAEALHMLQACLEEGDEAWLERISSIHTLTAKILFRLGRFDESKTHCLKAIALADPDELTVIEAQSTLTKIALENGHYSEAITCCEELISLCEQRNELTELAEAFSLLSDIYKKQGNLISAAETFLRMQKTVEYNLREKVLVP
ncbi:tetratricopeptide repeat protein [Effusibacillus dendaii]|uniref:HTH cro/C1-type domain-containing protein n=1 Tax=Effusibacillus dendaii TaxID=2743772 RepID=A0A7I8D749_9BACL|nr:tetratricopeptide repeat protein [Effusibacillus dendaii]BCJ85817.1 hypothetical protein skT53_08020 [Effusibacillus dendaii]